MRNRPFITGGENPRPYSEVVAERRGLDPGARARDRLLDDVAELEARAAEAADEDERKRLQCEAEALRVELAEGCLGHGVPLSAR